MIIFHPFYHVPRGPRLWSSSAPPPPHTTAPFPPSSPYRRSDDTETSIIRYSTNPRPFHSSTGTRVAGICRPLNFCNNLSCARRSARGIRAEIEQVPKGRGRIHHAEGLRRPDVAECCGVGVYLYPSIRASTSPVPKSASPSALCRMILGVVHVSVPHNVDGRRAEFILLNIRLILWRFIVVNDDRLLC